MKPYTPTPLSLSWDPNRTKNNRQNQTSLRIPPGALAKVCEAYQKKREGLQPRTRRQKLEVSGWLLLVILEILHDPRILQYHNSQGLRYLGSCRIFSIHCMFQGLLKGRTTRMSHSTTLPPHIQAEPSAAILTEDTFFYHCRPGTLKTSNRTGPFQHTRPMSAAKSQIHGTNPTFTSWGGA